MSPSDLFPQSTKDVPNALWKSKTPIQRQADAAEMWLELTQREEPPSIDKLSSSPDEVREQSFHEITSQFFGG